jgi:hypothetical protein
MSTIKMRVTTTATAEQYTAALHNFGPDRSQIFSNSDDAELMVHSQTPGHADVTEGFGGVWERLSYDWTDPKHVVARTIDSNIWGGRSRHDYTYRLNADGTTNIDYVVIRDGKNFTGHFLGLVLGSVGKRKLVKAFNNSVKAVERRESNAKAS